MLSVFDCAGRTRADARHAVRAVFAPDGLFVLNPNVIQHAQPRAFAAADAFFRRAEFSGGDDRRIEQSIDCAAF